jgi:hypothetical protein
MNRVLAEVVENIKTAVENKQTKHTSLLVAMYFLESLRFERRLSFNHTFYKTLDN